jgi:hypothetical protein
VAALTDRYGIAEERAPADDAAYPTALYMPKALFLAR